MKIVKTREIKKRKEIGKMSNFRVILNIYLRMILENIYITFTKIPSHLKKKDL